MRVYGSFVFAPARVDRSLGSSHDLSPFLAICSLRSIQVSANGPGFIRGLGLWFLLAVPSTYTNSMVRIIALLLGMSDIDF